jgi:hypothetical protein
MMREEIIRLSEQFKGLSDTEPTIVWQALTIDIMSRLTRADRDVLVLLFRGRRRLRRPGSRAARG